MTNDKTPVHRQWLLLKSLSARRHGRTLREMAEEAGVGPKTIRRDLDLFRDLGFPLEEATGEFGRKTWLLKSPCDQPPLSFRALTLAIEQSHATHLLYQSDRATEPAFRDVYPYGFIYHSASIYLVAFDPGADWIKHYKVDRVEAVEVSNFPFQRPPDFDIAAHLSPSFGVFLSDGALQTIKVRFAPATSRYVLESKWHPSQVLTKQRDGSLLAQFELGCTEEIRSWILSFGRKAVVLEPEELRREIAEELRATLAAYESREDQLRAETNQWADGRSVPV